MQNEPTWVTAENVDEIADVLQAVVDSLEDLLDLADEYPVELVVAGKRFVFEDEASLDAVIAKIRADVAAYRSRAA